MPRQLDHGCVICATVLDPQHRNPKRRYLVVTSSSEHVASGQSFWCVAITGTLPTPIPADHVLLPWHNSKHPVTGLSKKCAAVCEWAEKISPADVLEVCGIVPPKQLRAIMERIKPPPTAEREREEGGAGAVETV